MFAVVKRMTMRVKEIERTANVGWSPASQYPIYMVAGTAAQQLDATFSTSSCLEIYSLNLAEATLEMPLVASIPSECRFHKVLWGSFGSDIERSGLQSGVVVAGADDGTVLMYDAQKMIAENSECLLAQLKKHPPEEVACVAWNRQVQHILASNFTGRCVVWDLRKNEPIIKVSDSMSRIKAKMVAWHPEVATQMCLSSEDDHTPVIQLWDLRYATSPLKVVYELPTNNQWSFDVQWCPRNPGLISSSTFDGHVTIYSLMGGGHPIQPSNKVAESFNTGDPYSQVPVQVPHVEEKVMSLQKPPKWVRKPVGASFAFGGKLVTFECPAAGKPLQTSPQRIVHISQVVTETELVTRSNQLQQALSAGQYLEFCALKASNSASAMEENIWNFLRVNFENEPRTKFLQLLGYDQTELAKKVANYTGADGIQPLSPGVDAKELAQKMSLLGTGDASCATGLSASGQASPSVGSKTPNSRDELSEGSAAFDEIASSHGRESGLETPLVIPTENDLVNVAIGFILMFIIYNFVFCMKLENKMAEAILLAIAGGPELLLRTQKKYFKRNKSNLGRLISSIVTHDWSHIVNTCDLDNWKEALALILTYALPEEFPQLCDGLAARLETERNGDLALYASLCYICSGNLEKLVENWVQNTENSNSPLALQDLVEKVMILKKAVEASRGQTAECGDALSERLSMYAGMLASQGNLATAAVYLGNSSNDMRLAALQDRLFRALGPAASVGVTAPRFPFQLVNILPQGTRAQPQTQQQQVSRAGFQRSGSSSGASQQVQSGSFQTTTTTSSSYYDQQQQQQQHQYSVLNGPTATHTTFSQQPAVSTGSVSSKGPLAHKYPSASYQRQAAAYGMDSFPQAGLVQPDYSQTQGYSQQNFYSANYSVSPAQTSGIYNPAASEQMYNPASTPGGPYAGPSLPSQAQFGSSSSSYQDKRPESAWNDPPVVGESKKSKPLSYEQPAPITSPLFGASQPVASEQPPPGAPINYPNYGNLYNPQEHQPLPQQISAPFNPLPANTYMPPPVQIQPPKPAPEPPAPVEKGPVPAEHKVLQEVLDSLLSSCSQRATNAQMKRKLEDVARKLEILYDKLREGALSQSVLLGLHQLVQSVQGCDYGSSLGVHTSLVSHGNFSEISTFMPALKVLLQTASQLNVYVQ
ncbi:hypothetical protein C0Q70_02157 [Pomacea canaliculata]|uniref:SRA1/Sec31 domain-containing protein n=1 Tax=Pomacea canaliculata TaxID=400727 RepID=A0A2T7Q1I6_POMCA|nr:hypothetical protein C0Q70_02157 [Pomacea canaliculata]